MLETQETDGGVLVRLPVPALSLKTFYAAPGAPATEVPFSCNGSVMETPHYTLQYDVNNFLCRIYDKDEDREVLKEAGLGNALEIFEDKPIKYDNWDIDHDVIENLTPVYGFKGRTLVTDGPVEIRLRSVFEIENGTTVTQDLVCYADSPRVDFHTLVHWNSPHRLLKAGFDLDINASRARSEIQFGSIERPTTANTGVELAKYEVCNRNYTDVSEPGFGAAILNDCKYGITVLDCNLRLSLHRGGTHPDYTGDVGDHEMTYSLLPHVGGFRAETVVQSAYTLNVPHFTAPGKAEVLPLVRIDAPNVIAEAIKPAEDGSDAFILRLYESEGTKTTTDLTFGLNVCETTAVNLLEDELEPLAVTDNKLGLTFRPFEIKSVKCRRS